MINEEKTHQDRRLYNIADIYMTKKLLRIFCTVGEPKWTGSERT